MLMLAVKIQINPQILKIHGCFLLFQINTINTPAGSLYETFIYLRDRL